MKKKVRFLEDAVLADGTKVKRGDVRELPKEEADNFIKQGKAEDYKA